MNTIIEKFMAQVNENKDALAVFDNERNLSRKELLLLADTIAARLPKGWPLNYTDPLDLKT